ncbi:MAG: FAD-dependent oxidoreductase [Desulfobacterales bacterium]
MESDALIIGGTPAGIQAALDLADSGIGVHLVTAEPFLEAGRAGADNDLPGQHRLLEVARHPRVRLRTQSTVAAAAGRSGAYRIDLRQAPRYVDTAKCTACGDCIDVCPVTVPGTQHKAVTLRPGAQPGCAVIDKTGTAPCTAACPAGIPVQGYVALIAQGRFQEALALIEAAIPFPGICGRVCTHPCEIRCRRGEVDEPVAIRLLKRFVSDWALERPVPESAKNDSMPTDAARVAVVGAGPAGMTVADRLAKLGYRVTVFEKLPVVAGMMGIGIPAYRLPREVIEREYRRIEALGVDIRLNTPIGPDGAHTLDDLFKLGYRAVCLAIGAHQSLALHIPGENLPGVVQGIELLKTVSLSQQLDEPALQDSLARMIRFGPAARALVLGGGNTAMDAARTLKRLGLKQVRVLYRRSREEMPALAEEIADAEQEGVGIEYLTGPVRIEGDEASGVTGLECVRMQLTDPDESGRRRPVPIPESAFRMAADLVVPAIGQVPDTGILQAGCGVNLDRGGRIQIQKDGWMTAQPGLFAAGDAVTRGGMAVVEAIGMGKKAADAIDAYLKTQPMADAVPKAAPLQVADRELTAAQKKPIPRVPVATLAVPDRLKGFPEVEKGYTQAEAMAEAKRCLSCGPCSECLACVHVCQPGAVDHSRRELISTHHFGAVLYADDPQRFAQTSLSNLDGVIAALPDDPLAGSAAAARAMFDLLAGPGAVPVVPAAGALGAAARIGVFVCRCGGQIADVVDTRALRDRAAIWPDVMCAAELAFACTPEAAETIRAAVQTHGLNRIVLAACSCCAVDQACYSCTFQRIRCRQNLGVLKSGSATDPENSAAALGAGAFAFVNIREQCAWPHKDDSRTATSKATAMIAAAVAEAGALMPEAGTATPPALSVMIIGAGEAAAAGLQALAGRGMSASHMIPAPVQIRHSGGKYTAERSGRSVSAAAVLFAPRDREEEIRLMSCAGMDGPQPGRPDEPAGIVMIKPGMLLCDPELDPKISGPAAAARITAWFGRAVDGGRHAAVVDPHRCRACNTCVETCEIGAPELLPPPEHTAWIDPVICTGCGTCAAVCPSNAICGGATTDKRMEAVIAAVLS